MEFFVVHRDGCEGPERKHDIELFRDYINHGGGSWEYRQHPRDCTHPAYGFVHVVKRKEAAHSLFEAMIGRDGVGTTVRLYSVRALTRGGANKAVKRLLQGVGGKPCHELRSHANGEQDKSDEPARTSSATDEGKQSGYGLTMDEIDTLLGDVGKGRKIVSNFMQASMFLVHDQVTSSSHALFTASLYTLGVVDYVGRSLALSNEDFYHLAQISLTEIGCRGDQPVEAMNASDASTRDDGVHQATKAGFMAVQAFLAKEDETAPMALFKLLESPPSYS